MADQPPFTFPTTHPQAPHIPTFPVGNQSGIRLDLIPQGLLRAIAATNQGPPGSADLYRSIAGLLPSTAYPDGQHLFRIQQQLAQDQQRGASYLQPNRSQPGSFFSAGLPFAPPSGCAPQGPNGHIPQQSPDIVNALSGPHPSLGFPPASSGYQVTPLELLLARLQEFPPIPHRRQLPPTRPTGFAPQQSPDIANFFPQAISGPHPSPNLAQPSSSMRLPPPVPPYPSPSGILATSSGPSYTSPHGISVSNLGNSLAPPSGWQDASFGFQDPLAPGPSGPMTHQPPIANTVPPTVRPKRTTYSGRRTEIVSDKVRIEASLERSAIELVPGTPEFLLEFARAVQYVDRCELYRDDRIKYSSLLFDPRLKNQFPQKVRIEVLVCEELYKKWRAQNSDAKGWKSMTPEDKEIWKTIAYEIEAEQLRQLNMGIVVWDGEVRSRKKQSVKPRRVLPPDPIVDSEPYQGRFKLVKIEVDENSHRNHQARRAKKRQWIPSTSASSSLSEQDQIQRQSGSPTSQGIVAGIVFSQAGADCGAEDLDMSNTDEQGPSTPQQGTSEQFVLANVMAWSQQLGQQGDLWEFNDVNEGSNDDYGHSNGNDSDGHNGDSNSDDYDGNNNSDGTDDTNNRGENGNDDADGVENGRADASGGDGDANNNRADDAVPQPSIADLENPATAGTLKSATTVALQAQTSSTESNTCSWIPATSRIMSNGGSQSATPHGSPACVGFTSQLRTRRATTVQQVPSVGSSGFGQQAALPLASSRPPQVPLPPPPPPSRRYYYGPSTAFLNAPSSNVGASSSSSAAILNTPSSNVGASSSSTTANPKVSRINQMNIAKTRKLSQKEIQDRFTELKRKQGYIWNSKKAALLKDIPELKPGTAKYRELFQEGVKCYREKVYSEDTIDITTRLFDKSKEHLPLPQIVDLSTVTRNHLLKIVPGWKEMTKPPYARAEEGFEWIERSQAIGREQVYQIRKGLITGKRNKQELKRTGDEVNEPPEKKRRSDK